MKAPPGAIVAIYYDGTTLAAGDWLRSPSGRTYAVMVIRVQQRGKHRGRQHLRCVVLEHDADAPEGTVVRPIHWYARSKHREGGPT